MSNTITTVTATNIDKDLRISRQTELQIQAISEQLAILSEKVDSGHQTLMVDGLKTQNLAKSTLEEVKLLPHTRKPALWKRVLWFMTSLILLFVRPVVKICTSAVALALSAIRVIVMLVLGILILLYLSFGLYYIGAHLMESKNAQIECQFTPTNFICAEENIGAIRWGVNVIFDLMGTITENALVVLTYISYWPAEGFKMCIKDIGIWSIATSIIDFVLSIKNTLTQISGFIASVPSFSLF